MKDAVTGSTHSASSRSAVFSPTARGVARALLPASGIHRHCMQCGQECPHHRIWRGAPPKLLRWLKFNLVGGIGIGVQFAALFVLKTVFGFDYLFATAFAVEAAVVHNFVWHEQFTWSDRITTHRVHPQWRRSLARFVRFNVTTGAVSIVGNLALMRVMVGAGHINYLVANAIAITLCSIANFLVSDGWVFEG